MFIVRLLEVAALPDKTYISANNNILHIVQLGDRYSEPRTAGSDICLGYAGKVQGKSKLKHVIAFQIVELDIGRSKT